VILNRTNPSRTANPPDNKPLYLSLPTPS